MPNKLQYDFFINIVRKRKRFSPWEKKVKLDDLESIKEYYNYSTPKAQEVLKILNKEQIEFIKSKLNRGGNIMSQVAEVKWTRESMVEVKLSQPDDFLKR